MNDTGRSRLDVLLSLLADEVAERLQSRSEPQPVAPEPPHEVPPIATDMPAPSESAPAPTPEPTSEIISTVAASSDSHTAALLARLALGVCIIVVLINIPFNMQGTAIARSIPSAASLIIRDGLIVKEATSPDIWVYDDNAFHRISSIETFEQLGYRWRDVHIVHTGYLDQFAKGRPRYVLLRCAGSSHYYRLDAGHKQWIVDIPTFEAEGYTWEDIKAVSCTYLQSLPDGDSIPPGRGSPPLP
ncbi:MAG: hypothetical protein ACJ8CR_17075 [Roseiflexaceae bacterium]